jgi:hypothetical protein
MFDFESVDHSRLPNSLMNLTVWSVTALAGRLALSLASGQGRAGPPAGYQHVRRSNNTTRRGTRVE